MKNPNRMQPTNSLKARKIVADVFFTFKEQESLKFQCFNLIGVNYEELLYNSKISFEQMESIVKKTYNDMTIHPQDILKLARIFKKNRIKFDKKHLKTPEAQFKWLNNLISQHIPKYAIEHFAKKGEEKVILKFTIKHYYNVNTNRVYGMSPSNAREVVGYLKPHFNKVTSSKYKNFGTYAFSVDIEHTIGKKEKLKKEKELHNKINQLLKSRFPKLETNKNHFYIGGIIERDQSVKQ